jgi:hypothetical protein
MSQEPVPRERLDPLLADVGLLDAEYRDFTPPPTAEILELAREARAERAGARTSHPAPGALAGRSESEQARHELNLAATLVLHQRAAGGDLAELAARPHLDPEGALVLACLMQLSGRQLAARFWFRFAAGGGQSEAAYCLYLAHRAEAEFHDADEWRRRAAFLRRGSAPGRRPSRRSEAGAPPQLAREVRSLLAQCYRGGDPRLSEALQATITRLGITAEDEFPAATPRPVNELIKALVPGL